MTAVRRFRALGRGRKIRRTLRRGGGAAERLNTAPDAGGRQDLADVRPRGLFRR
jgi:hypothetical protein